MTNLTQNEIGLLNSIARCEMNSNNGDVPDFAFDVNTYVWAGERGGELGLSEKAVGGVMSSLQSKGLIWVCIDSVDPDDSGMGFTEAGFAAWSADERANKS